MFLALHPREGDTDRKNCDQTSQEQNPLYEPFFAFAISAVFLSLSFQTQLHATSCFFVSSLERGCMKDESMTLIICHSILFNALPLFCTYFLPNSEGTRTTGEKKIIKGNPSHCEAITICGLSLKSDSDRHALQL